MAKSLKYSVLIPVLGALLLSIMSTGLRADEIEQHNGTKIIGTITKQTGDYVFVENKYGSFRVQRAKIKRMSIDKKPGILDLQVKESKPKAWQWKVTDLAVSSSMGVPFGRLSDFVGSRASLTGFLTFLSYKKTELAGTLGYSYSITNSQDIISFQSIDSGLHISRVVFVDRPFAIRPLLGMGYFTHVVTAKESGKSGVYADPYLSLKVELSYRYNKNMSFFIMPGHTLFFEQEELGNFFHAGLGVRTRL